MRRGILVLSLALIGALIGYYCCYLLGTSEPRALLRSEHPELSWLKSEFLLTDVEFQRISELHAGYLPQCREREGEPMGSDLLVLILVVFRSERLEIDTCGKAIENSSSGRLVSSDTPGK